MLIIDAQSVKNTETAHLKGYDGGKKVSGIKRHIAVDTQGLPHTIHVTAANISDQAGGIEMFQPAVEGAIENSTQTPTQSTPQASAQSTTKSNAKKSSVKTVLADGGYTGDKFKQAIEDSLCAEVQIAKRSELHTFKVIPNRWIVERSFSWLEKCRRLWKNCERLISSSKSMIQLAFIRLILKRS